MQIVGYRLYKMTLNCLLPFKIASGVIDRCETLLLEVWDAEGRRGLGEAVPSPLLTGECLEGCRWTLQEQLLPLLRGINPWSLEDLHREMLTLTRGKSARCCVDVAVHNLQAGILGLPLSRLLGTGITRFETNYSIGICSLEETEELARRFEREGYRRIKLKVGVDPEYDLERIIRLNEILSPSTWLRLDANCGWSRSAAVQVLRRCERRDARIELVEQPVARDDFDGLREVRHKTVFPIAADESVQGVDCAKRLLEGQCVDILNIKLMKSAGLWQARQIATLAHAYRCRLMVGGMVGESEISVTAAAALAASHRFDYADLDADILLQDTPFTGMEPARGALRLETPFRVWDPELRTSALRDDLEVVTEWQL